MKHQYDYADLNISYLATILNDINTVSMSKNIKDDNRLVKLVVIGLVLLHCYLYELFHGSVPDLHPQQGHPALRAVY